MNHSRQPPHGLQALPPGTRVISLPNGRAQIFWRNRQTSFGPLVRLHGSPHGMSPRSMGIGLPGPNAIRNVGPRIGGIGSMVGYQGPYGSVTINGNPGYGQDGERTTTTFNEQPVGGYGGSYGQQHVGGHNPGNMWAGGYGQGQGGWPSMGAPGGSYSQAGFTGEYGHGNGGPGLGGKKFIRDPPEKIAMENLPEDEKECPVCYNVYYTPADGATEAAVKIESCGHVLGEKCLDDWVQQNNTCPVCRKEFPVNF